MPVKVNALDHLVINVSDVARSAEWYHKILGMEIRVFDPGHGQGCHGPRWFSATRRSMYGRAMPTRSNGSPRTMKLPAVTISASSRQARPEQVVAHLKACGVAIEEGPVAEARGPRHAALGLLPGSRRQPDRDFVV